MSTGSYCTFVNDDTDAFLRRSHLKLLEMSPSPDFVHRRKCAQRGAYLRGVCDIYEPQFETWPYLVGVH